MGKKKVGSKPARKIYKGPRGGKYFIKGGRKVYLSSRTPYVTTYAYPPGAYRKAGIVFAEPK